MAAADRDARRLAAEFQRPKGKFAGTSVISLDQTTDSTAAKANRIPGNVALSANERFACDRKAEAAAALSKTLYLFGH